MTCMMFQLKYVEGAVPGKSLKRRTILSEDKQNQRKRNTKKISPIESSTKTGKKGESDSSTMNSRM